MLRLTRHLLLFILLQPMCQADWQYEFLRIYQHPPQWMLDQIHADFASVLPTEASSAALNRFMQQYAAQTDRWCLARIFIRKNHVFVQKALPDDWYDTDIRKSRLDGMLQGFAHLAQCVCLPNVDLIVCLLDSFDINTPVPIFGYAKNPHIAPRCILIPDFEALNGNEKFLNAVHKGNQRYPWSEKRNLAVFRGSLTASNFTNNNFLNTPRSKAVAQSLQFPYLIDARFTYFPGWEGFGRYRDFFSQKLSIEDHVAYKYQLLIDGNSCAYTRAYWQLFSNCVLFKQTSENIQWYYRALHPFVHYIPVQEDMSDLVDQILWAIDHDETVQDISRKAQNFAKNNLTYARVMQYLYHLLVEYAQLQNQ